MILWLMPQKNTHLSYTPIFSPWLCWTIFIYLHAHLHMMYYILLKFHWNPTMKPYRMRCTYEVTNTENKKTSLRPIISPGSGWPSGLGSSTCTDHCSLSQLQTEFAPALYDYKNGVLDLHVIKFISYLPKVGSSLRLPPPLKLVVTI